MISHLLFGTFLLSVGCWLLWRNGIARRVIADKKLSQAEQQFFDRQVSRRGQTNWMLIIVGGMIMLGPWIQGKWWLLVYWSVVLLMTCWIMLLAAFDMLLTRWYYEGLQESHAREQADFLRSATLPHEDSPADPRSRKS